MKGRIFTPEEVTRMLPLVRRIVMDLKACATLVRRHERDILQIETEAEKAGTDPSEDALREHQTKINALREKSRSCEQELVELGGQVEDDARGIVKFYGERELRIVYYTWRLGEGRVGSWYPIEKTYADRMSIDDDRPLAETEAEAEARNS